MAYVTVDIDVSDIIDEIPDSVIFEEARSRRGSSPVSTAFQAPSDVVVDAINMIRTGRVADGVTLLEREFLPKWKDRADCDAAYQTAMALKVAA